MDRLFEQPTELVLCLGCGVGGLALERALQAMSNTGMRDLDPSWESGLCTSCWLHRRFPQAILANIAILVNRPITGLTLNALAIACRSDLPRRLSLNSERRCDCAGVEPDNLAWASGCSRSVEESQGGRSMKKEQMVGTRLPNTLVRDLETIEEIEQSDRSTTVRKLLYRAIQDWKLDYYSRLYGDGKLTLARAARESGVSLWEMMDYSRKQKITAQYDLEDFHKDMKIASAKI
jgi:predicted HTH domain antitoxin